MCLVHRLGGHESGGWCTALEFDEPSCHVFVGDNTGAITMLKLDPGACTVITKLQVSVACMMILVNINKMLILSTFLARTNLTF